MILYPCNFCMNTNCKSYTAVIKETDKAHWPLLQYFIGQLENGKWLF